ncbi:MAG: hypothetical protein AB7H90_01580 [Alphaproteobacteria bacterium]
MDRGDIERALAALDRALDGRSTYQDLVEASRCLVGLRGMLIAEHRRGAPVSDNLARLNTIISLVVAAAYPLEGVRHERIKAAKRELLALAL